jgi:hypothetical protein
MKTPTHTQSLSSKTPTTKLGPGEYRPAGIFQRVEDLPKPKVVKQQRDTSSQPCPQCGQPASRHRSYRRRLHDLGDLLSGRPCILEVSYSQHYCSACQKYFNFDLSDLAVPKSLYTHRVQDLAVRLVIEDGLPYRTASWHLWRDHRVFVPFATIQNWVEAGGKKGQ